ncbi:MAG TPA: hypothetical protein VJL79_06800 [Nitrososphaera sp.]|nr:hypothetical protein [Nitrososphaera sp.]
MLVASAQEVVTEKLWLGVKAANNTTNTDRLVQVVSDIWQHSSCKL